MSARVMMKRIREASPRLKARFAGLLLVLSILMAAFNEFFVRGRVGTAQSTWQPTSSRSRAWSL
jgi:hypothetical protein